MILSAHQPNFIPWTGYFLKVALSDIHVILDDVEYSKNGWTNRNKVKLSTDSYITLPVRKKDTGLPIKSVMLAQNYRQIVNKARKTLKQFYGKSPGFNFIDMIFQEVLEAGDANLFNVNYLIIARILDHLQIETPLILMSNTAIDPGLKSSDMLVDICIKNNCDQYLSGIGAKDYLQEDAFKKQGIDVLWSKKTIRTLEKFNISNNSIIEMIFMYGDESANIMSKLVGEVLS